jgi:hypothetical protein
MLTIAAHVGCYATDVAFKEVLTLTPATLITFSCDLRTSNLLVALIDIVLIDVDRVDI